MQTRRKWVNQKKEINRQFSQKDFYIYIENLYVQANIMIRIKQPYPTPVHPHFSQVKVFLIAKNC